MGDPGTPAAAAELREKIRKLNALLDAVLEERSANEAAVERSKEQTNTLLGKSSELAAEEGRLRQEIAQLEIALEGLER